MIGIMQGRLLPLDNQDDWLVESRLANEAGIPLIEWVWPHEREYVQADFGVQVKSICADIFMAHRLIGDDNKVNGAAERTLVEMMHYASQRKIPHIVLPFVDQSSLRNREQIHALRALLRHHRSNVDLHLETDLDAGDTFDLMNGLPSGIRLCYDIGNIAVLGYPCELYIRLLCPYIGSVHVKDRKHQGPSVPLGSGAADFHTAFATLKDVGYRGNYILQTARAAPRKELEQAISDRKFVESFL